MAFLTDTPYLPVTAAQMGEAITDKVSCSILGALGGTVESQARSVVNSIYLFFAVLRLWIACHVIHWSNTEHWHVTAATV